MKERSLVVFTLLTQMAVSAFWMLEAVNWRVASQVDPEAARLLVKPLLLLVGPLVLASLLASLLHLGSPQRAWRALANLRTSWLSREILFALAFAVLGGIYAFLEWFQLSAVPWRAGLAALTALCGAGLIYSMGRVYRLPTVPIWNTSLTLVSFFVSSLLLGSLGVGAALIIQAIYLPAEQIASLAGAFTLLGAICLICLAVEFVIIPLQIARLVSSGANEALGRPLSQVYLLRLAPLVLGIATACVLFFSASELWGWGTVLAFLIAFILALSSEVFGRILFYESRIPLM